MAMNRTVLWRFDTVVAKNAVHDCDAILERAAWLPDYDTWSVNLSLPTPLPVLLNTHHNAAHARRQNNKNRKNNPNNNNRTTMIRRHEFFFSKAKQRQRLHAPVVVPPRFRDFIDADDMATSRVHWHQDPVRLTRNAP